MPKQKEKFFEIISAKLKIFASRVLNVSHHEWARITISWVLKFLLQIAMVAGATLLTALFVDEFSVQALPKLYIIQALAVIFGVVLLSSIVERVSRKNFILGGAFIASVALIVIYFFAFSKTLFFGAFIVIISVIMAQISIVLSLFVEELFSPLESERTFPIVESSEPIGSLVAGITILITIHFFDVYSLLLVLGIIIFLMVPTMFFFMKKTEKVPVLRSKKEIIVRSSKTEAIKQSIKHVRIIPFLRMLATLVFVQYVIANILEFQFTKAVDANISHGESHASALTSGLGTVHVFISIILLISQLFIFGKVLKRSGVSRTISFHPFLVIISFFAMVVNYTFYTAVASKTIYEVTGAMFKNAHQVSFFALKESIRIHAKEFLEGISKPLGAICGTIIILILQFFLDDHILSTVLNAILIVLGLIMLMMITKLSEKHTLLARKNLEMHGTPQEKLDAIEVLAQKGHKNAAEILVKELSFRKDDDEVQIKILRTLGILADLSTVPAILDCFEDKPQAVQLAAVKSLSEFKNLGEHFLTQAFAKIRVTEALKKLFLSSRSKTIKTAVVHSFTNIKDADVVPFLLEILESEDEEIRAEGVFACGLFHDPTVSFFLDKFLADKSPYVRSNAIISLWQFKTLRLKLLVQLTALLESNHENDVLSGIFAIGEIKFDQETQRLIKILNHENEKMRKHAAIALAKINHEASIPHLIDFLWHKNKTISLKVKSQLESLHPNIQKIIKMHMVQRAAKEVTEILRHEGTEILEELSEKTLRKLMHIFTLIDEEKRVLHIKDELESRKKKSTLKIKIPALSL